MNENKLPTKPGPYYWREKDGDEWEIHTVFIDDELNNTLMASCPIDDTWYATENWGGQWLPIPTADELVELQAAKKMMTDLVRAAKKVEGMLEPLNQRDDKHARDFSKAISACEPVTIIRKAKR